MHSWEAILARPELISLVLSPPAFASRPARARGRARGRIHILESYLLLSGQFSF